MVICRPKCSQPRQQFVADQILDRPEVLTAKPRQAANAERHAKGGFSILPGQQRSQLDFGPRQLAAQPRAASYQVAQPLIGLRWNVGQRNLIDPQQVRQQLGVELVGLRAALYHGAQVKRMGQEDRAVRTQQIVEPAIRSCGFDHRAEYRQLIDGLDDRDGVLAGDADGFHGFSCVVDRCQYHGCTVKIDTNVPHE